MGKYDKKAKSDRINALRKKYDAFLEEEKNRKERNEFILERLDKMRSCAILQFHHTVNQGRMTVPQLSNHFFLNRPMSLKENDVLPTLPVNNTNNQNIVSMNLSRNILNEDTMIREISKKYILIPKLGSIVSNERIQTPTRPIDDNSDWQRKYDILKQLKQNEKDQDFTNKNQVIVNSDSKISQENYDESLQEEQGENGILKTNENLQKKCASENMPKKNIHYDETKHQLNDYTESFNEDDNNLEDKVDNTQHYLQEQIINKNEEIPKGTAEYKLQGKINVNHTDDINSETNYLEADSTTKVELQTNYDTNVNVDDKNVDENENVDNEQFEPITYEQYSTADKENEKSDAEKVVYLDEHDVSPIEVLNPEELVTQVNEDINVKDEVPDMTEYPVEVINTADFTPHDNVELQDGENINPEVLALNQNEPQVPGEIPTYQYDRHQSVAAMKNPESEDDVHTSQIEAFNDEQNEMFYSEQQNYGSYNANAAADAFHTQYSDQNDAQGEQYQYYKGTQEEQPYSTDVNEHEETSEKYDPNYEQQYVNSNYEQQEQQQEEYVQPSQQYEHEVYDETPQEFDRQPFEEQNYDPQQIEQQLDSEQGFSEVKTTQGHTEPVPDQ